MQTTNPDILIDNAEIFKTIDKRIRLIKRDICKHNLCTSICHKLFIHYRQTLSCLTVSRQIRCYILIDLYLINTQHTVNNCQHKKNLYGFTLIYNKCCHRKPQISFLLFFLFFHTNLLFS